MSQQLNSGASRCCDQLELMKLENISLFSYTFLTTLQSLLDDACNMGLASVDFYFAESCF